MKKNIFLLIAFLGVFRLNCVYSQFQSGIFSSNQAGVLGTTINPANCNFISNGVDFMPLFFSTSVLNNDFYLKAKPITSVIRPEIFTAFKENETLGGETINQKFNRLFDLKRTLKDKGYIFADLTIYGPSFLTGIGRHSFGITTSLKSSVSTVSLPKELAIFLQKGIINDDITNKTFKLGGVQAGAIVYKDIALNYSYKIRESYLSQQRIGVNLHYLAGINSVVFQDNGNTSWYINPDDTSVDMTNANVKYNYAAVNSKSTAVLLESRGSGFGLDLGYSYYKKRGGRPTRTTYCPNIRGGGRIREFQNYKWKFGISAMDIGSINFNKNTQANTYTNALGKMRSLDGDFYKGVFALNRAFYYGFIYTPAEVKTSFTQNLATRINVQFDWYFKNNWYFNFLASQRTPMSNMSMLSPNITTIGARYETLKYEFGIPFSLIEYQYPVLGFNFRYGPLLFGSNQILELVGIRSIKGLDMYLGLKFNISNIRFRGI